MPLASGTRLGPYEVGSPIGKGGMGEVYRARDTKLDREVAIKVLPEEFAKDDERLARFEREESRLMPDFAMARSLSMHSQALQLAAACSVRNARGTLKTVRNLRSSSPMSC